MNRVKKEIWKNRAYYFMLIPAVLTVAALYIYPVGKTIYLSFCDFDLLSPEKMRFISGHNYAELITSSDFLKVLSNSLFFTLITVLIEVILGLACALLLNKHFKGRAVIRTLWLLPVMFSPVVAGYQWKWLLNDQYGLINYLLLLFGILHYPKAWLTEANWAMISIMIADIWFWTPFAIILIVAGLQSLPSEPFEAAKMDGANSWQQFWYIAFPLLTPVLIVVILLRAMDAFKIFDIVYILTYGGPGLTTEMINTYGYKIAFRHFRLGISSAIAITALIVMVVMAVSILMSFKKKR